jgi:hypothetical protein
MLVTENLAWTTFKYEGRSLVGVTNLVFGPKQLHWLVHQQQNSWDCQELTCGHLLRVPVLLDGHEKKKKMCFTETCHI